MQNPARKRAKPSDWVWERRSEARGGRGPKVYTYMEYVGGKRHEEWDNGEHWATVQKYGAYWYVDIHASVGTQAQKQGSKDTLAEAKHWALKQLAVLGIKKQTRNPGPGPVAPVNAALMVGSIPYRQTVQVGSFAVRNLGAGFYSVNAQRMTTAQAQRTVGGTRNPAGRRKATTWIRKTAGSYSGAPGTKMAGFDIERHHGLWDVYESGTDKMLGDSYHTLTAAKRACARMGSSASSRLLAASARLPPKGMLDASDDWDFDLD